MKDVRGDDPLRAARNGPKIDELERGAVRLDRRSGVLGGHTGADIAGDLDRDLGVGVQVGSRAGCAARFVREPCRRGEMADHRAGADALAVAHAEFPADPLMSSRERRAPGPQLLRQRCGEPGIDGRHPTNALAVV
jgi:hypothetical protein